MKIQAARIKRSRQRPATGSRRKRFDHPHGTTVVETVLLLITVGMMALVVGGMTGKMSDTFRHASLALFGFDSEQNTVGSEQIASNGELSSDQRPATNTLIGIGALAAALCSYMAYTSFIVSRAEGKIATHSESESKPAEEASVAAAEPSFSDSLLDRRSRIGRTLRHEMADFDCTNLNVAKFMTSKPMTIKVTDDIQDVMKLMITRGFRHLVVVDDEDKMCGIISDRDLVDIAGKSIVDVMTKNPYHVDTTTPITIAITMFVTHRISALPVLDNQKVAGIVTRSDLLVAFQCLMVKVQEELSILQSRGPTNSEVPVSNVSDPDARGPVGLDVSCTSIAPAKRD